MAKKSSLGLKPARPKSTRELSSKIKEFEASAMDVQPIKEEAPAISPSPDIASPVKRSTIYERADDRGQDYRSTVYFPVDVHNIMKAYCAAERISISKFVTQLVETHLGEIGPVDDSNAFMMAYYKSKMSK
jgi:hypothetical protein